MPVKHRSLLKVPRPCRFDRQHAVIVVGVDQHNLGRIVGPRHTVVEIGPQRQNVPPALIPRNREALADVAKKMMLGTMGDLPHVELEFLSAQRSFQREDHTRGKNGPKKSQVHQVPFQRAK